MPAGPRAIAVWGSNTDVGKTLVSAGVFAAARRRALDALYLKPVQTGVCVCVPRAMPRHKHLWSTHSHSPLRPLRAAVRIHLPCASSCRTRLPTRILPTAAHRDEHRDEHRHEHRQSTLMLMTTATCAIAA